MSKPEIARITPFERNETVQIFGENLSEKSKVYWWRKSDENRTFEDCGMPFDEIPSLPPEDARVYNVSAFADKAVYIYGEQEIPGGNALMWVENDGEISKPFMANETEVWNQSVVRTFPGGAVSFYGPGMHTKQSCKVLLRNTKTGEFVRCLFADSKFNSDYHDLYLYRTNCVIPENTPDGEYEAFVHSGIGGVLGWAKPVKLTVDSNYGITEYYRTLFNRNAGCEIKMPKCPVYSLTANPLGAFYDITAELQSLIDKAHNEGGGIVVLSSGTFGISETLKLKDGVVLVGAGENATTISAVNGCDFKMDFDDVDFAAFNSTHPERNGWAIDWAPHYKRYEHKALVRIYGDAGMNNIHIELGHGITWGVLVASNDKTAHCFGSFLNKVNIDGGSMYSYDEKDYGETTNAVMVTCSTTEFTVFDCKFIAKRPLEMLPAYNDRTRLVRCLFKGSSRQTGEVFINGLHNSQIIECECIDGRRSFMSQNGFENNWVCHNKSAGVSRATCAGEVYMSEYGCADWGGYAESVGEDYVDFGADTPLFDVEKAHEALSKESIYIKLMDSDILTNQNIHDYPRYVCILMGRGLGQYRKVVRIEGTKLILDRPWDVMPDSTTAFTVTSASQHNIWVDNDSSLSAGHSQFMYGSGIDNIISGHECYMSAGIFLHSITGYDFKPTTAVIAYNRIAHCAVRSSGKGIYLHAGGFLKRHTNPDFLNYSSGGFIGNSVRKCAVDGSRNLLYTKNQPDFSDPRPKAGIAVGGAYNTVCDNRIGGYAVGVKIKDDCVGNCLDKNIYEGIDVNIIAPSDPLGTDLRAGNAYIR